MNRLFIYLHRAAWLLLLLEVLLLVVFGVSYKGYEFDWLVVFLLFASGLWLFFTYRKEAGRVMKIYLCLFPVYTAVALLSFITEPIFFIVIMMPLWVFILPNNLRVEGDGYSVRDRPTVMGQAQVNLYKNYFIFERDLGALKLNPLEVRKWQNLQVIDSSGKISFVQIKLDSKDSLVQLEQPVNYYDRK